MSAIEINIFKIRVFYLYLRKSIGFFMVFGVGLHWKDITKHRLYFSERNGFKKHIQIGNWRITYLKN